MGCWCGSPSLDGTLEPFYSVPDIEANEDMASGVYIRRCTPRSPWRNSAHRLLSNKCLLGCNRYISGILFPKKGRWDVFSLFSQAVFKIYIHTCSHTCYISASDDRRQVHHLPWIVRYPFFDGCCWPSQVKSLVFTVKISRFSRRSFGFLTVFSWWRPLSLSACSRLSSLWPHSPHFLHYVLIPLVFY